MYLSIGKSSIYTYEIVKQFGTFPYTYTYSFKSTNQKYNILSITKYIFSFLTLVGNILTCLAILARKGKVSSPVEMQGIFVLQVHFMQILRFMLP